MDGIQNLVPKSRNIGKFANGDYLTAGSLLCTILMIIINIENSTGG